MPKQLRAVMFGYLRAGAVFAVVGGIAALFRPSDAAYIGCIASAFLIAEVIERKWPCGYR